jgi:hypothetical protein
MLVFLSSEACWAAESYQLRMEDSSIARMQRQLWRLIRAIFLIDSRFVDRRLRIDKLVWFATLGTQRL